MTVKKGNNDNNDFSDSNMNSTLAAVVSDDNRTEIVKLKKAYDGSNSDSDDIKKGQVNEILDDSETVYLSTGGIKKEEIEENEDIDIEEMQLKAEHVEIKAEDK